MMGFVIFIHVVICLGVIFFVLIQSGRGGGLTEQLSSAESLFGAQTNVVLIRITSVLATIFFVTCLSLAFLSSKKNESIMARQKAPVSNINQLFNIEIPEKTTENIVINAESDIK